MFSPYREIFFVTNNFLNVAQSGTHPVADPASVTFEKVGPIQLIKL